MMTVVLIVGAGANIISNWFRSRMARDRRRREYREARRRCLAGANCLRDIGGRTRMIVAVLGPSQGCSSPDTRPSRDICPLGSPPGNWHSLRRRDGWMLIRMRRGETHLGSSPPNNEDDRD